MGRIPITCVLLLTIGLGCRPISGDDAGLPGPAADADVLADGGIGFPDLGTSELRRRVRLPLEAYRESRPPGIRQSAPGTRFIAVTERMVQEDFDCRIRGEESVAVRGGRYTSGHLFQNDGELQDGDEYAVEAAPTALRKYCVLEWVSNANPPRMPRSFAQNQIRQILAANFAEFSLDLQVIAPQASGLNNTIWAPLAANWRAQIDELRPLPTFDLNGPITPIRIAVADTSPRTDTGQARDGLSDHGLAMGQIAKVLSCPPGGPRGALCPGYVSHHLALPRVGPIARPVTGGFYGYQGEVARAIGEAVQRWRAVGLPDGQAHLVINLSLGWDARWGGPLRPNPASLRPPVRAVFDALGYAACRGALVIAAAGNRSGGPIEARGPLYPAGWERVAAPTPQQCQQFFGVADPPPAAGAYQPLLYSVGGVRPDDRPLGISRPGGIPRLVVPAFQATIGWEDASGDLVSTGIHTGSSIAAAAMSGIAATLWAYRPDLGRHEIMDAVYAGAVDLDPDPDGGAVRPQYCLRGMCGGMTVRRVSMCQAFAEVCKGVPKGACPSLAVACATPPAFSGTLDALEPLEAEMLTYVEDTSVNGQRLLVDGAVDASVLSGEGRPSALCDYAASATIQRNAANDGVDPEAPCPAQQFYMRNAQPSASPQPFGPLCPTCYFASGTKLGLFIDETHTNVFYDGLLTFTDTKGNVLDAVLLKDLDIHDVTGGDSYIVNNVSAPASFDRVFVEFLTEVRSTTTGNWETVSTIDELAWW